MHHCYIAQSLNKTGQFVRSVCTRCHRLIQKKIWRRQGDIWRRPDQFLSAWIFPYLDRLHDRRWQSCMSGKGTLVFFFILIMCFVFNIIDQLHNYITVFAVTVYLFECPFKMKYSILNRLIYIW